MDSSPIVITIILTSLLILLLLAGIAISFFEINRHKEKQKTILIESKLNFEKELRQVTMEVSEELKSQIARELHDHLGHQITCLRLEIENQKLNHPELKNTFDLLDKYVTEASQQTRLVSRTLNKDFLSAMNLNQAIDLEIERQVRLGVFNIDWTDEYSKQSLDKNQELILFRIFQEVVNNALKHSQGQNLVVSLTSHPKFLFIIRDDGKGFELDEILNSSKASGLRNITKRAEMAGLSCEITTAKNQGCEYRFSELLSLEES